MGSLFFMTMAVPRPSTNSKGFQVISAGNKVRVGWASCPALSA